MRDKLAGMSLRTTLLYVVFAALCFVLSGKVVSALVSDADAVIKLDVFKGLAFVAVTAFLLYATLRRQTKWLEREVDGRTQAEQLMRESQARFVTIFRSSPMGITLTRLGDGRLVDANPAFLRMLGYDWEEIVGRTPLEAEAWVLPDERNRLVEAVRAQAAVEGAELQFRTKSGEIRTVLDSAELIRLSGKDYLLDMMIDITDKKRAEEAKEREHRDVFETSAIGTALVALDGRWLKVSRSLCDTIGYSEGELLASTTVRDITHPDDLRSDDEFLKSLIEDQIPYYRVEKRYFHRDGHTIWGLLGVSVVRDGRGCPLYFVTQLEDITERKFLEEKLQTALRTDSLTGLFNRNGFFDLSQDRLRSQESKASTLFLLRINGMKLFNDRFGCKKGDAFIASAAHMLEDTFRERDIIGRIGGVEFAVLVTGEAERLAAQLERNTVTLTTAGQKCLSASIGVARSRPDDKLSLEQLISRANETISGEEGPERKVSSILRKRRRRLMAWKRSGGKDRLQGPAVRRRPALSQPRPSLVEGSADARRSAAGRGLCIPFSVGYRG